MNLFIQFYLNWIGSQGDPFHAAIVKAYRQMCGEASSNCRHVLFVAAKQRHMKMF